jgi:hypothetical protein
VRIEQHISTNTLGLSTAMVGVKTWSDDQIQFILTSKSGGMKVQEIITQCKQRWPRKEFKDTGVRYVITNYGKDPEYGYAYMSNTVSNWCSFQSGATSRQSQHKSRPRGRVPATHLQRNKRHLARPSSSPHTNPQHITLRTKPSATHSPSISQNNYAAGMREVAGGPIQATLTSPQPLQILTSQVDSQARTLAHAQQAQDIGIVLILRGAKVASQSPKDKFTKQQTPSLPSQNFQGGPSIHNNMAQQGQNLMGYGPPIAQYRPPFRDLYDQNGRFRVDADDRPFYGARNSNPNLPNDTNGLAGLPNPQNSAHLVPYQMLPPPQPYQARHQAVNAGTLPTQQPPHQLPTRSMQLQSQDSCPVDPALSNQHPPPPPRSPQSVYQPAHMPPPQMVPYVTMPQFGTGLQDWTNNTNPMGSLFTSPTQVTPGQSMSPAQHLSVGMFKAASYGPPAHRSQLGPGGPNPGNPDLRSQFPPAAQQFNQSSIQHNDGLPMWRSTPYARRTSWPPQFFNIDTNDGWTWERVNGVTDPDLLQRLSPSGKALGPGIIFYWPGKDVRFYVPGSMAADIADPFGRSPAHPNIPRHCTCNAAEASLNNPLGSGPLKGSLPETRGMASSSKEQPKVVDRASGRKRATSGFDTMFPPKPAPQSISESTPFAQAPLIAPPQANSVSQPALRVAAQRGPQQGVVNQGMSTVVSNNSSVQQNVAPSMQPSPQLPSSHSMEANNRPTIKRKGPCSPAVNESSPPKRPRAENHNAQIRSGPSQPMQPDDSVAQFPSERTMSPSVPSGLQMPAGSNVSNPFGDSLEYFKLPEKAHLSVLPQASGNIDNPLFNPNPSGPLSGAYLNSPQSSQLFQRRQARSSVGPPMPLSDVPSQVAAQFEHQKEQADIVQAEDQHGQNNNYRSEQTYADDDFFDQFTNLHQIHAENSSEQV